MCFRRILPAPPLERDVGSCFGLACSAGLNQAGLKAAGVHMHADGSLPFFIRMPCEKSLPAGRVPVRVRSHGGRASSDRPRSTGELVDTLKSQMCHRSTCHPHRVDIHGEGTSLSPRITRDPGSELAPRGLFTASHTPLVGRSDKSSPYMINRQPRKPMECAPAASWGDESRCSLEVHVA